MIRQRHRREWTDEEVDLLSRLHAQGMTSVHVALRLDRGVKSVQHKARELGLVFGYANGQRGKPKSKGHLLARLVAS